MFPLIGQAARVSDHGPFCHRPMLGFRRGTSFSPGLPAGQKTVTIAANDGTLVTVRRSNRYASNRYELKPSGRYPGSGIFYAELLRFGPSSHLSYPVTPESLDLSHRVT